MIYFAQAKARRYGPVKIGYATSLKSRLRALSAYAGEPIIAVATKAGSRAEEAFLHEYFSAYRTRGPTVGIEWFAQSHELADLVRGLGGELTGPFAASIQRSPPDNDGIAVLWSYIMGVELAPCAAANAIGCTTTVLLGILRGERRPSDMLAEHMERWSSGSVPSTSWTQRGGARFLDRLNPARGQAYRPDVVARREEAVRRPGSRRPGDPLKRVAELKLLLSRAEKNLGDAEREFAKQERRVLRIRKRIEAIVSEKS